ncbi:MAG: hypothetical protein LQ343_003864 [Gyalolechia ehrenbergii]|nr:MAG: hypothetical protein LQ343_003864 [Gyalolechia ehrenbergii]
MLCLKLWWLLLPLSAIGHPLFGGEHKETAASERLGPRDGAIISELEDRSTADLTERAVDSSLTQPNIGDPRDPGYANLLLANLQPEPPLNRSVLLQSTLPGPLQNSSLGTFGAYKNLGERIEFDFEYPPYTRKKIIVVRGSMDTETTQTEVYVEIMGFPIGDFIGNLDDGMRIDVNLMVAKGFIMLSDVQGPVEDSVYLIVDLHLPFRKHLTEKWLLFRWGHHDLKTPNPSMNTVTA